MVPTPSRDPASDSQDHINGIQLLAKGLRRHLERQAGRDQHESPARREATFGVEAGGQSVISADTPILGV